MLARWKLEARQDRRGRQNRPIQGITTPPDEILKQTTNTVGAYGVEAVAEIYERTVNGANPSTFDFWQEIKKLKAEKGN